jgi:hypothetical protein
MVGSGRMELLQDTEERGTRGLLEKWISLHQFSRVMRPIETMVHGEAKASRPVRFLSSQVQNVVGSDTQVEEWESQADLDPRLRSEDYRSVLAAMEFVAREARDSLRHGQPT